MQVQVDWLPLIKDALQQDEVAQQAEPLISQNDPIWSKQEGLIYWRGKLFIPDVNDIRRKLIKEAHESGTAGHPGIQRTLNRLQRQYYWPNMRTELKTYIMTCDTCQRIKASRQKPGGLLQPLPIPTKPWRQVSMDFITGLPVTAEGYDTILVFSDKLTRMVHLVPTRETCTVEDVAELFLKHVYRYHGLPKSILSDRDTRFTSHFWTALHRGLGTELCMSTHRRMAQLRERTLNSEHIAVRSKPCGKDAANTPAAEDFIRTRVQAQQEARRQALEAQNRQQQYANRKRRLLG